MLLGQGSPNQTSPLQIVPKTSKSMINCLSITPTDLLECNVHVFPTGSDSVKEKLIVVTFLSSDEGQDFTKKYSDLKFKLENLVETGELPAAEYSKQKGPLLKEIIEAAHKAYPDYMS